MNMAMAIAIHPASNGIVYANPTVSKLSIPGNKLGLGCVFHIVAVYTKFTSPTVGRWILSFMHSLELRGS